MVGQRNNGKANGPKDRADRDWRGEVAADPEAPDRLTSLLDPDRELGEVLEIQTKPSARQTACQN